MLQAFGTNGEEFVMCLFREQATRQPHWNAEKEKKFMI